jgi:hypothetical protein
VPVVSDLLVHVRAEGVQETAQQVRAVGDAAQQTARALQIMAESAAKSAPTQGSAAQILELFQKGNVQPTAAAMAQAASEMQRTAVAAQQAAPATQAVARAAADHATSARTGAQAAQSVADGWKLSESSAVRFGTALVGINLGISLVAGAARLVHDAIADTAQGLLDWERSLVQVRAMYGDIAPQVVALSQAQAALPGVVSSQASLVQANLQARFLTTRYGVSPDVTGTLTTQGARFGGLLFPGSDQEAQRTAVQDALLQYAQSGNGQQLQQLTGQPLDPLTLARRLGYTSESALQGLTPQQIVTAQTQLGIATVARGNIQGGAERRGLLDAQRALQENISRAQAQLQNSLENIAAPQPIAVAGQSDLARATNFPLLGPAGERQQQRDLAAVAAQSSSGQIVAALQDVKDARTALTQNTAALADNQKQLDAANAALSKLGLEAGSAAARLLSFTGSLEDVTSIARGDIAAQAQSAVAQRGRSAIPGFGTPTPEIVFQATQTAYQSAFQNYVNSQAQAQGDNAIREYLQRVADREGPGGAASRALDQARLTQPIYAALGENQRTSAQIDLAAAERQAELDRISLDQRERYVQMMRDTVELRLQDNSLQQQSIRASADVIRAQQAALPAEHIASAAQYQQDMAQALAQRRMALLLTGQDVSGEPNLDQLIQMRYQGQIDAALNKPALVADERGVAVAQEGATAIGMQQALVESNIHLAELQNDARNLLDIPTQTGYQLELVQISRDQIGLQTEMRELLKALVYYMTTAITPPSGTGQVADRTDRITRGAGAPVTPSDVPGARRGGGPF